MYSGDGSRGGKSTSVRSRKFEEEGTLSSRSERKPGLAREVAHSWAWQVGCLKVLFLSCNNGESNREGFPTTALLIRTIEKGSYSSLAHVRLKQRVSLITLELRLWPPGEKGQIRQIDDSWVPTAQ